MKQQRLTAIVSFITLIFCCALPADALELGARATYWFPAFTGDVKVDGGGLAGSDANLKDNLGVGNEAFPSYEAFGGWGRHHLSLMYTPIDYSGTSTLTQPVIFGGQTFTPGTTVATDLRLRMLDLEYEYTVLDMENILAGFSIGGILKVKYFDGDAQMNAPGQAASQSVHQPVPGLGIAAHIGLLADILEARARVSGIAYGSNNLFEALGELSWTPFPFLDLTAGYRYLQVHIDNSDLFLSAQLTGPYVGVTVSF
jgi:hypothetical protein